jgi:CheY-like chemotaxis protein
MRETSSGFKRRIPQAEAAGSQGGPRRFVSQPPAAYTGPESGRGGEVRRVLVIDDNPAIQRDFRRLLCPEAPLDADLDVLEAAIFGTPPRPASRSSFQVDVASQGQEGLEMIRRTFRAGRPYALVFVDMRMPPGWDGIETIERMWTEYPDIEAVICSAYSDYSWHDVIRRVKRPELRLLTKPFESRDVLELAWSLTSRWLRRNAKK